MIKDEMKDLTLQDILAADDAKAEPVNCPEWGGRVWVCGLGADEHDELEQYCRDMELPVAPRSHIFAKGLCTADGVRVNPDPQQIDALGAKSSAAMTRCVTRIYELSGLTDEAAEELEKNSGKTPSDGSP